MPGALDCYMNFELLTFIQPGVESTFEFLRHTALITISMHCTKFVLIISFCLSTIASNAQESADSVPSYPINSLNVSVGEASGFSFQFEKLFKVAPKLLLAARAGIGFNQEFQLCIFGPCTTAPETYATIPISFTANFGKRKNYFEIGLGNTIVAGSSLRPNWVYGIVGYRLQPIKKSRLNFRVFGCIPFSDTSAEILFLPVGVSTGLTL